MKDIYASLDIGSSTIKLIVAEVINSNIHILFSKMIPSHGVKQGIIIDEEAAKNDIKLIISQAKDYLHADIERVLLSIPANQCSLYSSVGTSQILSVDHLIVENDILKALKKANRFEKQKTEAIVSTIPVKYTYDKVETDKIPLGKKALTLKVDTLVITSAKKVLYPYIRVTEGAGLEIIDICINAYAGAKEAFDEASLLDGAILIDIGHQNSTISYFEDGFLKYITVAKKGSYNLTRMIANDWKITLDRAELYKVKYGSCKLDEKDQDIVHTTDNGNELIHHRKYDLSKVLIDGVKEVAEVIKEKLDVIKNLPEKEIVIVGGGGELEGIETIFSEVLGCKVRVYRPQAIGAREMAYVSNLGLIYYLLDRSHVYGQMPSSIVLPEASNTIALRLKGLTKSQTQTQNDNKLKKMIDRFIVEDEEE